MSGPAAIDPSSIVQSAPDNILAARRLGVDTQHEAVVFMRKDCHICRAEGFSAHSRVLLSHGGRTIAATLNQVTSGIVAAGEAGLSESAWKRLQAQDGDLIAVSHPQPLESLSSIRGKVYGRVLNLDALKSIISDVTAGRYSDIDISAFITACAARPLDRAETIALTQAMVDVGDRLDWGRTPIVDKHSVGGLPGNRTTPIVVAIAAACGLIMPKTSSRAITSPAGTADTMEVLAPVELDLAAMRRVVEREGGCVVWGGSVRLSPADDILIRVERALDIDSEGQLVASILSKKLAAGSDHLVIDMPVGATAKVRDRDAARDLEASLVSVAAAFGLKAAVVVSDGQQPVGRGIGPSLEAKDVLAVLQNRLDAPADLRAHALPLAGALLEMGGLASHGAGAVVAADAIEDGRAWRKFQQICEAQGGMRTPPSSAHQHVMLAPRPGRIDEIDNRRLARVAKLAGAPDAKTAGLELHVRLGDLVERTQPLYTVHAEAPGELAYALSYAAANPNIYRLGDE